MQVSFPLGIRHIAALTILAGMAGAAAGAPFTTEMWCLNWVDPITGVARDPRPSHREVDISKQFTVAVEWDEPAKHLRVRGLTIQGLEVIEAGGVRWINGKRLALSVVEPQTLAKFLKLGEGAPAPYATSLAVVLNLSGASSVESLELELERTDEFGGLNWATGLGCRSTPWTASTVARRAPAAGPSSPSLSPAPSVDAKLSYQGSLLAAVIGAVVAVLIGLPMLNAARRQAKAAEDALEHSRQQAASSKSMELMLKEGPEAIVARLQRLSDQALRAADRGDMEAFVANAKALAGLRDSLHRSLVAAVAPLNSTMEKMSKALQRPQPDLDEVMQLLLATHATLPDKASELRIHLRQLLAAIATVLESEGDEALPRP